MVARSVVGRNEDVSSRKNLWYILQVKGGRGVHSDDIGGLEVHYL